jgi:hypothetical protein
MDSGKEMKRANLRRRTKTVLGLKTKAANLSGLWPFEVVSMLGAPGLASETWESMNSRYEILWSET